MIMIHPPVSGLSLKTILKVLEEEEKNSRAKAGKPSKPVCPKCNTEHEEGTMFCKNDGEKLILK